MPRERLLARRPQTVCEVEHGGGDTPEGLAAAMGRLGDKPAPASALGAILDAVAM